MKRIYLLLTGLITCMITEAQLNESFNDGNFNANPVWSGTTTEWTVVVSSDVAAGAANSNTLRLNNAAVAATDYLSTQILGSWGTLGQTWIFWWGRRAQAATNANRSFVWLYASEADVTSVTVDGYRIRFGDDTGNDEIVIESVTDGVSTVILTSSGAVINGLTDIGFLVRVNRSVAGVFTLYTSVLPTISGGGDIATVPANIINTPVFQGTATNTLYTDLSNGYISIAAQHSSALPARTGAEFDQVRLEFNSNAPLPVTFGNIRATEKLNGIQIDWIVYTEEHVQRYEVERSENGILFSHIGSLQAINSNFTKRYEYFDSNNSAGNVYYRIKCIDQDGQISYSNIIMIARLPPEKFTVRVFNIMGQLVYSGDPFQMPERLKTGIYIISIVKYP